jgi:molybdopterin-guanine dinucleotide biosynthesis protein A
MGQDKLLAEAGGLTLLERTARSCESALQGVKLVVRDPARFRPSSYSTIIDWPHAQGPLGGIIAALLDCSHQACFVTAADLYDLSAATINRILNQYRGEDYLGVSENGQAQPLCGIYNQSALVHLQTRALRGEFGARAALEGMRSRTVDIRQKLWRNINTPEDLRAVGGQL